jgi:hypothetical protein
VPGARVIDAQITLVGVGSELKRLLGWLFIRSDGMCRCDERAAIMDRNGPDWCSANLSVIVGWLRESAAERGRLFALFARLGARPLVLLAIYLARRKLRALL